VYTAAFGADVALSIVPTMDNRAIRFVCYTDDLGRASKGWELRLAERGADPRWLNRKYKFPLGDSELAKGRVIYVDANIQVNPCFGAEWDAVFHGNFMAHRHP